VSIDKKELELSLVSQHGYPFIAIDEAGRGPLAGPLSVSGVLITSMKDLLDVDGVDDSKKINEKARKIIFEKTNNIFNFKNVMISSKDIDKFGLTYCLNKASAKIIKNFISYSPKFILLDGKHDYIKSKDIEVITIIKGDAKTFSIGLASINAKVNRDREMIAIGKKYPEYNFSKNKGYGTKEHIELIKKFGVSDIHRASFLGKIIE
jgi:ribonuclease HII